MRDDARTEVAPDPAGGYDPRLVAISLSYTHETKMTIIITTTAMKEEIERGAENISFVAPEWNEAVRRDVHSLDRV